MFASIWRNDSWWRLIGLALGLFVCVLSLRDPSRLPWAEIVPFALLAVLLRQRIVPQSDETGKITFAHIPGEMILIFLLLRYGREAAAMASLLTNVISMLIRSRDFLKERQRWISVVSNIFWLPFQVFMGTTLYYQWGGHAVRTAEDCVRLFQDPFFVVLPLFGALVIAIEGINRFYFSVVIYLHQKQTLQEIFRNLPTGIFEHLENAGAVLILAVWTTWGWGTLPFLILIIEALLYPAHEYVQRRETHKQIVLDPLTGLSSARGLSETLSQRIAARQSEPFAILFLDLDRFKHVNDTYGHAVGDQLLRVVGEALKAGVRPGDLVARRSRDEFVVVLPRTGRAEAELTVQRLHAALTRAISGDTRFLGIGFSAGIALFPGDGQTEAALLEVADQAMYAQKRRRKAA